MGTGAPAQLLDNAVPTCLCLRLHPSHLTHFSLRDASKSHECARSFLLEVGNHLCVYGYTHTDINGDDSSPLPTGRLVYGYNDETKIVQ